MRTLVTICSMHVNCLLDAGTVCFLLLTLLVKKLRGYRSEIACTCCLWDCLHTTVSINHINFLVFTSILDLIYETNAGGLSSEWFGLEASLLTMGLTIQWALPLELYRLCWNQAQKLQGECSMEACCISLLSWLDFYYIGCLTNKRCPI